MAREFLFFLNHFFALASIAFIAYLIGRRLTRSVIYICILEQIVFSVAVGLAIVAYTILFLGLAGLLYRGIVVSVLLAGALICLPSLPTGWTGKLTSIMKTAAQGRKITVTIVITILAVVLSLPAVLLPLYPPTAFDATLYHLAVAKVYAENHAISLTPFLRFPVFPQHNQMLFTLALILYDDILAQLIEFLLMIILAAALVAFGRRYFSTRAGLWGAALFLSNPLVIWLGSVAYVDMCLMLYVTMSVYGFYNWLQSREQKWLFLAGSFCGVAIVTKYPALLFLLLLGIAILYMSLKDRRLAPTIIFSVTSLAAATPWFLRNTYYTGNPIFPFFNRRIGQWFGYRLWRPEYLVGLYETSFEGFNKVGVGTSFKSLITLPWNLAFNQSVFLGWSASLSSIYFFLIPVLLFGGIKSKLIRGLIVLALAHTLFWYYTIQDIRYLLPALPILGLAEAASVDLLLSWVHLFNKGLRFKVITAMAAVLLLLPGWQYARDNLKRFGKIPVNQQERDSYLTRHLPSYPAYKFLNQVEGRSYTVYSIFDGNMVYFVDGVYMGDFWGPARYSRVLDKLNDGAALYVELRDLKADYLLVNNESGRVNLVQDASFNAHFETTFKQGKITLFRIID